MGSDLYGWHQQEAIDNYEPLKQEVKRLSGATKNLREQRNWYREALAKVRTECLFGDNDIEASMMKILKLSEAPPFEGM